MIRILLFTALFAISLPVYSADTMHDENLNWFNNNYVQIENVLAQDADLSLVPYLNTLIVMWTKRDGAMTGEISPLLAVSLINHPELTLRAFAEHPKSYERWLTQLQGTLFTDFSGNDHKSLKKLHCDLSSAMENYSQYGDESLIPLAMNLLESLKAIEIRVVD
ncbi:hypothetical protein Q4591_10580 [Shewanella sp. 3_MG-2023]|uniref:hypothetical protein n=1 Tax=Shewanella sp. 3_MG-2023 TaxID=3062635 RepID=UPI0026E16711|nr:hypothetical protein [Shewanella sp. 3_MG-2023]MDO6775804.1 hypothetical protein [Shewanella sp. 3_MG-2023]